MKQPTMTVFTLILVAMGISMPLFAIEVPEFEVLEETPEVEIRQYPALTVARTRVSADFKSAGNEGCRRRGGNGA